MKAILALFLAAVLGTACADPRTTVSRCPACKGERSLSLTPPNLGQHDGEIGVTPGKPFANHRWDVKHDRCPLCKGTGRHETWVFKVRPPEDRADKEPCTTCWWSGVEPCRRCNHTGFADCTKCRSSRSGSKAGWIVEETTTSGRISGRTSGSFSSRTSGRISGHTSSRSSKNKKIKVSPCPECSGIGKVRCTACDGMGGQPCRRCKGAGYTEKRVKR